MPVSIRELCLWLLYLYLSGMFSAAFFLYRRIRKNGASVLSSICFTLFGSLLWPVMAVLAYNLKEYTGDNDDD